MTHIQAAATICVKALARFPAVYLWRASCNSWNDAGSHSFKDLSGLEDAMDLKLALFIVLIGAIIGLSHLSDKRIARMKRQFVLRRWREIVPGRHKS